MQDSVVFFGTGPVAAASLRLMHEWASIEAVVTKPLPAHHKGSFPVLETAAELGLRIETVTDKASLNELFMKKPFVSRLAVLIDFGIIVSRQVIDYFPLGIVNSHFSLLPEWRGADPITFSILSGQTRTGVSLMLLVEQMDEGPLLSVGVYDMLGDETTPVLTDRLIDLSNQLLRHDLPRYVENTKTVSQLDTGKQLNNYPTEASYSRKLTKQDSLLDFMKPAKRLEREIRAFIDWPKSKTQLAGKDVIVTAAHAVPSVGTEEPGIVRVQSEAKLIMIDTTDGRLCIDRLKPAGKAEMTAAAFLAGYGADF